MHNRDRYIFFLDPAAWAGTGPSWRPGCKRGVFGMIRPNPATYLKRYGEFLAALRAAPPRRAHDRGLPRLSPFPAFGPQPHSYLAGWDALLPRRHRPIFGPGSGSLTTCT